MICLSFGGEEQLSILEAIFGEGTTGQRRFAAAARPLVA